LHNSLFVVLIVLMLSKELILLIVIAFLVCLPIAYYGMKKWLQDLIFLFPEISNNVFEFSGFFLAKPTPTRPLADIPCNASGYFQ